MDQQNCTFMHHCNTVGIYLYYLISHTVLKQAVLGKCFAGDYIYVYWDYICSLNNKKGH